jgi:hypothetical protein
VNPEPATALHWNWLPQSWVDVVQIAAFVLMLAAVGPLLRTAFEILADKRRRRRALTVGTAAVVARLLVPLRPFKWYSGVSNVDLGARIYSKATTYMPPPTQLITFTLGFYDPSRPTCARSENPKLAARWGARSCRSRRDRHPPTRAEVQARQSKERSPRARNDFEVESADSGMIAGAARPETY